MNLKELKHREVNFLNSHKDRFEEYGRAYRDILKMCEEYAGPKLSEEILISDMANEYAEIENKRYLLTKNEKHLMHIKIANELSLSDQVSFNEVYKFLNRFSYNMDFNKAKEILLHTKVYKKVNPKTLIDVLNKINEEKGEVSEDNAE